jgi:hypothetical protein
MALTEFEVKYAAKRGKPYKLADGGGLHVFVQPNGSKLWRMKYRFAGKEKLPSFGKYPDVSLVAARARRNEARELLAQGQDPGVQRGGGAPALRDLRDDGTRMAQSTRGKPRPRPCAAPHVPPRAGRISSTGPDTHPRTEGADNTPSDPYRRSARCA